MERRTALAAVADADRRVALRERAHHLCVAMKGGPVEGVAVVVSCHSLIEAEVEAALFEINTQRGDRWGPAG